MTTGSARLIYLTSFFSTLNALFSHLGFVQPFLLYDSLIWYVVRVGPADPAFRALPGQSEEPADPIINIVTDTLSTAKQISAPRVQQADGPVRGNPW